MSKESMIDYVTYLADTANKVFKEAQSMEKIKNPSAEDVVKLAILQGKLEVTREYIGKFTELVTGKKK
jgi:hypothetical protein